MMRHLFNGEIARLNVYGILPIAIKPSPPAVWEQFVTACEAHDLVSVAACAFCEGAVDADAIIVHSPDCPFDQLDQAMADYQAQGRIR